MRSSTRTPAAWEVNVHFKNNDFVQKVAKPYVNKQVAIELDGVVQSAPTINQGITGQDVTISGNFTSKEAHQLALVLRYGSLPVQLVPQTAQTVSPTLGKDQLRAGIVAGLIGLALVALYMILFYRLLGLVVWIGIGLTALTFFTLVSWLSTHHGLTLTLAGVTGIIVSVGVTVDSYVVYFERLKDEVRTGKTVRSSLDTGFRRAFRTIIAADLVSIIGAVVLYLFATSSVRGFAFFLGLSTLLDLILAYCFMWPFVSVLARRPALVTHGRSRDRRRSRRAGGAGVTVTTPPPPTPPAEDIPGVTRRHRLSDLYHERTNFQFIKHSRRWLIISTTLVVVSLAAVRRARAQPRHRLRGRHGLAGADDRRQDRQGRRRARRSSTKLGFSDAKVSVLTPPGGGADTVRVEARVIDDPITVVQDALAKYGGVSDARRAGPERQRAARSPSRPSKA